MLNWLKKLFTFETWEIVDPCVEVDSFGAMNLDRVAKRLGPDYRFRKIKDAPNNQNFCSCSIYVLEKRKS